MMNDEGEAKAEVTLSSLPLHRSRTRYEISPEWMVSHPTVPTIAGQFAYQMNDAQKPLPCSSQSGATSTRPAAGAASRRTMSSTAPVTAAAAPTP